MSSRPHERFLPLQDIPLSFPCSTKNNNTACDYNKNNKNNKKKQDRQHIIYIYQLVLTSCTFAIGLSFAGQTGVTTYITITMKQRPTRNCVSELYFLFFPSKIIHNTHVLHLQGHSRASSRRTLRGCPPSVPAHATTSSWGHSPAVSMMNGSSRCARCSRETQAFSPLLQPALIMLVRRDCG